MVDLFISYSSQDRARIQPLVSALEQQGWSVFWDRHIPAGKTWRSYVGQALTDARCVLVVWSSHSIESRWVSEEADEGPKRGILVPVLLEAVEAPIGFRSIQAADLSDWKLNGASARFQKLVEDIKIILISVPSSSTVSQDSESQHNRSMPFLPPKGKANVLKHPLVMSLIIIMIAVGSYLGYQQWKPDPAITGEEKQQQSETSDIDTLVKQIENPTEKMPEKVLEKTAEKKIVQPIEKKECSISGLVFDSDTNQPLSAIWVDLYRDMRSSKQRPLRLKVNVATTGPNGKFTIDCSWVEESQFPLIIALRHKNWVATRITGARIEDNSGANSINIPISISSIGMKPLPDIGVSYSSKQINSDWFLIGVIENKSERTYPCIGARFRLSTSFQDKQKGEPDEDLGFFDVEVQNLEPSEKRAYKRKLPKQAGIGFYSKSECD
ncbi:MAG: toll/interleukin-1 receptor domain-containing protein [Flavobacteriaceae bacterium]|nr:toll/interleukin-1 receptor domain-containing protein [Flavobacteriaceae bacterium]